MTLLIIPRDATIILIAFGVVLSGFSTASLGQAARKTDEEVYQDRIRSCEWGYKSRTSSRNYRDGTTRSEVDAKYQKCLETERKRYDMIVRQRARDAAANQQ